MPKLLFKITRNQKRKQNICQYAIAWQQKYVGQHGKILLASTSSKSHIVIVTHLCHSIAWHNILAYSCNLVLKFSIQLMSFLIANKPLHLLNCIAVILNLRKNAQNPSFQLRFCSLLPKSLSIIKFYLKSFNYPKVLLKHLCLTAQIST